MSPEVKTKWLTALRSGEYEQGYGNLRRDHNNHKRFCPLGVLCDLAVKEGITTESSVNEKTRNGDYIITLYDYDNIESVLPRSVRQWAALDFADPILKQPLLHRTGTITLLNDYYHCNFSEIADMIEEQL
jgi:hypothetical protein